MLVVCFFFQAEDGIRYLVRSRGLGDVYKRQLITELEGLDRGRYAGAVGWVDAAGNGQWAVGIRLSLIHI